METIVSASTSSKSLSNESNFAYATVTIVEMVTRYLSGFDIMAMWCTCSKAMQLRLGRGGAREFIISYTAPKQWSACFFRVIQHMPLLTTIIIQQSRLPIWRIGPKIFWFFPKTVKRVNFCLPLDLGSWLLLDDIRGIESLALQESVRNESKTSASYYRMAELLPFLEELSVMGGSKYSRASSSSLEFDIKERVSAKLAFASSLPSTMKYVSLPDLGDATWHMIKAMPEALERIDISCTDTSIPDTAFSLFPPHLHYLDVEFTDCSFELSEAYFDALSHAITKFHLTITSLHRNEMFLGLSNHPMTHLKLQLSGACDGRPILLENLPSSLESLELIVSSQLSDYGDSLAFLPRSLTRCSIQSFTMMPQHTWPREGYDHFPANLTHLELFSGVILGDADILRFPRSITHLHLGFSPVSFWDHTCEGGNCHRACSSRHSRDVRLLTDECAGYLPPNLTYLRITKNQFKDDFYSNLPSTLKTLETVAYGKTDITQSCFDLLPSGLTCLSIEDLELPSRALQQLPSGLTSLSVEDGKSLSPSVLAHLPRDLLYLTIGRSKILNDGNAAALPRRLLEIRMPDNDQLTSNAGVHLPVHLSVLEIKRIAVPNPRPPKADILSTFPQFLQIYDLPWTNERGNRKVSLASMP